MIRRAAFAVVLCLSAAAFADGDQPKAPAAKPAPAAKEDTPSGFKATVSLDNGRALSGVVRVTGSFERRDEKAGWVACGKDDAGACVRLWYVSGGEGYLVIEAKHIKSVEDRGVLSDADIKKIAGDSEAAGKRADAEREKLKKEREAKAKAAAEAPKAETPEEAARKAAATAAEERAAELLAKFPPKDWTAERRDEIKHRELILKLMPTPEEREFVANFDEWSKAAAAAAAKEIADKKDAEKKAGEKPDGKKPDEKKPEGKKDEHKNDDEKKDDGKKGDDHK
jgi:hypothetical protein